MIVTGIYTNLSSEEYHGDKNSISRSALMDFKKNPRKYWANHLNPNRPPNEIKPSREFGTAFHSLILEPKLFSQNYTLACTKFLLKDVGEKEYRAYKLRVEELEKSNKIILPQEQMEKLSNMQHSLLTNPKAKSLIEGAVYESSYFWQDKHSGLILKSRPDILHSNIYVDLKTIDDASPQNYQREMLKYGYHLQAAMVKDAVFALRGEKLSACINLCVEKSYPYSIGIYIIDEAAIEQGQYEYKNLCLELKNAIMLNEFRDYEVQTIGLPKWAI